jgi:photosystem II stability/assembly factor-like uncharacterized protein
MISLSTGWGLTDQWVMRTIDGGRTWENISPKGGLGPKAALRGDFLDAMTAWVQLPDPTDAARSTLFRTSDGGDSWDPIQLPFGAADLQILDATHGFAFETYDCASAACPARLFATSDNGKTWSLMAAAAPTPGTGGLPLAGVKTGVRFRDPLNGVLTGAETRSGQAALWVGADGGKTWEKRELPVPGGLQASQISLDPPVFLTGKEMVMPATYSSSRLARLFYLSHDGGQTWTANSPVYNSGLWAVAGVRDFYVWDGTTLQATHDAGKTWTVVKTAFRPGRNLLQVEFSGAKYGWALVSEPQSGLVILHKTTDGGRTWNLP